MPEPLVECLIAAVNEYDRQLRETRLQAVIDASRKLDAEIARIKEELGQQKKLIKDNANNKLLVETATSEMKALHTRLSTLEANEAKESAK